MKKLLTTLSVSLLLICMLSVSVFADDLQEVADYGGYGAEVFAETAQGFFDQMISADDATYAEYLEQYTGDEGIYEGFELVGTLRALDEEFIGYGQYNLYENKDAEAICYQVVHFEKSDYIFVVGFDQTLAWNHCDVKELTYLTDQDESALLDLSNCKVKDMGGGSGFTITFDGPVLLEALRNAVIGILVVFCMLVFIALIISLFKYIPSEEMKAYQRQQNKTKQAEESLKVTPAPADVPAAPQQAPSLTDDKQLVAVIAAAIAEYEGKSADSFIVRTINKRKWK